MSFEVDSNEVRRAAKEIREIAKNVRQISDQNVRRMQSSVEENLKGEAADALAEVLLGLSTDIRKISSGLDAVQAALFDYARRIEEADAAAENIINNR